MINVIKLVCKERALSLFESDTRLLLKAQNKWDIVDVFMWHLRKDDAIVKINRFKLPLD